jgi:hypothetical protein
LDQQEVKKFYFRQLIGRGSAADRKMEKTLIKKWSSSWQEGGLAADSKLPIGMEEDGVSNKSQYEEKTTADRQQFANRPVSLETKVNY